MNEYLEALKTAIENGLCVLVVMCVVAGLLTVCSGASATLGWKKKTGEHSH